MPGGSLLLSLAEKLVKHPKRIVFPEGTNPQVVRAASRYAQMRMGPVVLLGQPDLIRRQAKAQKVELDRVMILDPVEGQDRQMFKDHLRSEAGGGKLKLSQIDDTLSDPIVYGTLMLRFGQVDGLVAGVGAYSGNVLRPLIRMIPRLPHISRISSATLLECEDGKTGDGGLLLVGDAAVVPRPTSDELAATAVGLAGLKKRLTGRNARVALLSYSTRGSAALNDETGKMIEATKKARVLAKQIGIPGEFMTWSFSMVAYDQIVNNAGAIRYMSGGQYSIPIVFRGSSGAGLQVGATHSHTPENWYANVPALTVITPAFPDDAKGLLKSAIRSNNPVCFIENEKLYGFKDEVPEGDILTTIGKARIRREGSQVTLIANSASTHVALASALQLEADGISAEVLDLRTIKPLDLPAILGSVAKTNRVVIVEENKPFAGWGAQVAYEIQNRSFDELDAPIERVTGLDVPQPYSRVLEQAVMPSAERVTEAAKKTLA